MELTQSQLAKKSTPNLLRLFKKVRGQALWRCEYCLYNCHDPEGQKRAQDYRDRIKAVLNTREHVIRR
jgi:hypothetical protein